MKLYYKPGVCSRSPHIILAELNMAYELESVDLVTKQMSSGDFKLVNPKGSVPALKLDSGEILTEGAVIVQYLADLKPEMGLMPKVGTMERYRCLEWLNFVATEVHKSFSPMFGIGRISEAKDTQDAVKKFYAETLYTKIGYISEKLGNNQYLMGETFTVPDAYLFTVLSWLPFMGMNLDKWPNMKSYMARVSERPSVVRVLKEEAQK